MEFTLSWVCHQYLLQHPTILVQPQTIHEHYSNNGIIEQIQNAPSCMYPYDALHNDYLIYAEIQHQIWSILMVKLLFHHVNSHQKEITDCKLMLWEKLNIDYNACAAMMTLLSWDSPVCTTPFAEAGYPHFLQVKKRCIIQCLQHMLHDAAIQQPYFDYLTRKFDWPNPLDQNIYWPNLCLTLKRFKATDQRTIIRFIHKWLLLQDCYHMQSASMEQLCPSCHQSVERVEHFLAYPHPNHQQVWKELHCLSTSTRSKTQSIMSSKICLSMVYTKAIKLWQLSVFIISPMT